MSKEFINRNHPKQDANQHTVQKKKKNSPGTELKEMNKPANHVNWNTANSDSTVTQKFAKEEEGKQVQQKRKQSITGKGTQSQMPGNVQAKMENSFGTDFSNVNIHKNSQQAEGMGALAYTQGNDVHFAPGQFKPDTTKGQELIGHELTHVVQQRQGRVKPTESLQKHDEEMQMMRKEAQLKKQQSIEHYGFLGKSPEQQMQLKLKYGAKQLKVDIAKKQFRQFKKQQLAQLKRGNPARKEFAAKSRNFEHQMVQQKIAYGSNEYNQAVQAYFPDYTPQDMGIMQARAKVVNDLPVNDNPALEKEADVMGAKAAQGKMVDNNISKGAGKTVQKKDDENEKDDEPWKITKHYKEGHTSGYQHVFDENGRLIILTPVAGQDVFYITNSPDSYSDKGNGARVGVSNIQKVSIKHVLKGLSNYYRQKNDEQNKFIKRLYRYNKQNGYDYVQYISVHKSTQPKIDFFEIIETNNGKRTHTTEPGDNYSSLSKKYGIPVEQLRKWNGYKDTQIPTGVELIISPNLSNAKTIGASERRPLLDPANPNALRNDMIFGDKTNEDIIEEGEEYWVNLYESDASKSDEDLFLDFKIMSASLFTSFKMASVLNKMINYFKSNDGGKMGKELSSDGKGYGVFTNKVLNQEAQNSTEGQTFLNTIQNSIIEQLNQGVHPDKIELSNINDNDRPRFNDFWTHTARGGLTIAINDTQAFDIILNELASNDKSYFCNFKVIIYDHFGLDEGDVTSGLFPLAGFRAWYRLQRERGYRPFVTKVSISRTFVKEKESHEK